MVMALNGLLRIDVLNQIYLEECVSHDPALSSCEVGFFKNARSQTFKMVTLGSLPI